MNKITTPQANDWNRFWSLDQTKKFTKVSWSKRRIIKVLAPFVGKNKRAFDAGCGSGFFSKYFCDQGMETVALDYSKEALRIAHEITAGKAKPIQYDLVSRPDLCNTIGTFDLIFTDGLMEHFSSSDQDAIMKNLLACLNEQGVLVTFVPNRWSPWELIRPFFMPGIEEIPFTIGQLKQLNERNGLKVIQSGGVNTWPFAFSLDKLIGSVFGMLLYTIAQKSVSLRGTK